MSAPPACRLCGGGTRTLFTRTVLARHRVAYHQCETCGLTQTDAPHWLEEAYASPIHPTDTGILARNLDARRVVATFLHLTGVGAQPCLDWAGGFGLFTRLMRDAGFAFLHHDPMAENLFARGFEWHDGADAPFVVTAFEVLEHFVRPLEAFGQIAAFGARYLITRTELHPGVAPAERWPYLSVESGQHVAFYRRDTLARLGAACGYPHVLAGPFYQLFARERPPAGRWGLAVRGRSVLYPLLRRARRPLTLDDCERLRRALRR
jgi:hypothetical protein